MRFVLKLLTSDKNFIYLAVKKLYRAGIEELFAFDVDGERHLTFIVEDQEDVVTLLKSLEPNIMTVDPSGFDFDKILPGVYRGEAGLDYDCIHGEIDYSGYADGE